MTITTKAALLIKQSVLVPFCDGTKDRGFIKT